MRLSAISPICDALTLAIDGKYDESAEALTDLNPAELRELASGSRVLAATAQAMATSRTDDSPQVVSWTAEGGSVVDWTSDTNTEIRSFVNEQGGEKLAVGLPTSTAPGKYVYGVVFDVHSTGPNVDLPATVAHEIILSRPLRSIDELISAGVGYFGEFGDLDSVIPLFWSLLRIEQP